MATAERPSRTDLRRRPVEGGPPPRPIPRPTARRDLFGEAAAWTVRVSGSRWAFLLALAVVLTWAISGPLFRFSEFWQLVINTGTTIVTFLMVFLIQNAQNRESKAIHIKLDELIHAVRNAHDDVINVESLTEEQLDQIGRRYRKIARRYHESLESIVGEVSQDMDEVKGKVEQVERRVREAEAGRGGPAAAPEAG